MGLLLSPDHAATLTDPHTWKDNPFITRDARRDIKKRQPFLSFCWMAGVLLVVASWTVSMLWSSRTVRGPMPLFVGVDIGTGLFIVVSGVHIWFIIGAARKHTSRLFTEESNQNTLSGLLMLPISPFQILLQAMAYPWMAAMRLAIALLPVYVFCVGLDGPSWLELVMLYLVFALASLSVPFWSRPALSENVGVLAAPKQEQVGMGAKQTVVGQGTAGRSGSTSGALALRLLFIPIALIWVMLWQFGNTTQVREVLNQYLPDGIVSLLGTIIISWPLVIARLLVTPLDWFGLSLIPLPFVIIMFCMSRYVELVRASEFLSVGAYRDLPLQSTYLPRIRVVAWLRIALAIVVTGYLWKWAVVNGAFALFALRARGAEPGLGGFAFLLVCFASAWGMARGAALGQWQLHPLIRGERHILCRSSFLNGVRYLCEPIVFALTYYFCCCLLARAFPFPALSSAAAGNVGVLLAETALIGLSGAVLSFGVSRLFGPSSIAIRVAVPCLIALGAIYAESVDFRGWLASFPQLAHALAFVPLLMELEIFSPVLGILRAAGLRATPTQTILPPSPGFTVWVVTGFAVGTVLWLLGHLLGLRRGPMHEHAVILVFDPTKLGREVFSDPVQMKRSGIARSDTPFVIALIAALQHVWDNAVVTRELRSRLRGQWDRPFVWSALGLATVASVVFFHPALRIWPTIFGGWLAYLLMGGMNTPLSMTATGVLGCWYLVLFVWALGTAFSTTGAFYAETQKSTLGFLLSTPMSTRSIVLGKAFGLLGPSTAVFLALSAWTLILTVLFLPLVGPIALAGWFYAVLTALTFYLMVNSITFSISAMFPKLSMSGSAWVWVLLFWFGSGPLLSFYGMLSFALIAAGLQGASLWFAFIAIGWVLILVGYMISLSSVQSMRRRDLSFATSKRNN